MSQESADTRATAYLFGELSAEEKAAFESELEQSTELQDELAAIGEAVDAIRSEFEADAQGVKESQRHEIEAAIGTASVQPSSSADGAWNLRRLMIGGALAAGSLIAFSLVYPNLGGPSVSMNTPDEAIDSSPENIRSKTGDTLSKSGGSMKGGPMKGGMRMKGAPAGQANSFAQQMDSPFGSAADKSAANDAFATDSIDANSVEGNSAEKFDAAQQADAFVDAPLEPAGSAESNAAPAPSGNTPLADSPPMRQKGVGNRAVPKADQAEMQFGGLQQRAASRGQAGASQAGASQLPSPTQTEAGSSQQRQQQAASPRQVAPRQVASGQVASGQVPRARRPIAPAEPLLEPGAGVGGPGPGLNPKPGMARPATRPSLPSTRPSTGTRPAPASPAPAQQARSTTRGMQSAPTPSDPFGANSTMLDVTPRIVIREEEAQQLYAEAPGGGGRGRRGGAKTELSDMDIAGMGMGGMAGGGIGGGGFAGRSAQQSVAGEDEMGMMMGMGAGMAGDQFDPIEDNPFMESINAPLSTFSVDVDTAAYAKVRMFLMQQNSLPRPAAVRIEELVNYFQYGYEPPTDEHPFAATMDIAECPWNAKHRLARIGIKGKVIEENRPSSNLVFLLDVSGSMNQPNKLPLVIDGMKMLTDQLTENDSVAIVVYAGAAGLVLDSTRGDQKQAIVGALERLKAGGSTNGGQGIQLAYQIARDNFIVGGTNRVMLCSDGDFNVGVTGTDQLVKIAEENAKSNIYLSVLGFGMGNHNDAMMEKISNQGNGNYAFIDSKAEARKVLVEQMGGTLVTIAKDVKIQVEFNPKEVAAYRLIGYENRILAAQDFNDDTKDAGEIGAGHTVTALYELVPVGEHSEVHVPPVDDLRYQRKARLSKEASSGETLTLKLRYKQPDSQPGDESTLIQFPVSDSGKDFSETDADFQFAASVAAFGMLLRNSPHQGEATFAAVEEIASGGAEGDSSGYRAEFVEMVRKAALLRGEE